MTPMKPILALVGAAAGAAGLLGCSSSSQSTNRGQEAPPITTNGDIPYSKEFPSYQQCVDYVNKNSQKVGTGDPFIGSCIFEHGVPNPLRVAGAAYDFTKYTNLMMYITLTDKEKQQVLAAGAGIKEDKEAGEVMYKQLVQVLWNYTGLARKPDGLGRTNWEGQGVVWADKVRTPVSCGWCHTGKVPTKTGFEYRPGVPNKEIQVAKFPLRMKKVLDALEWNWWKARWKNHDDLLPKPLALVAREALREGDPGFNIGRRFELWLGGMLYDEDSLGYTIARVPVWIHGGIFVSLRDPVDFEPSKLRQMAFSLKLLFGASLPELSMGNGNVPIGPGYWRDNHLQQTLFRLGFLDNTYTGISKAGLPVENGTPAQMTARWKDLYAFIQSLRPSPFPFPIDETLARAGFEVFQENCKSCHNIDVGPSGIVSQFRETRTHPSTVIGSEPFDRNYFDNALHPDYLDRLNRSQFITQKERHPVYTRPKGLVAQSLAGVWESYPYGYSDCWPDLLSSISGSERPLVWKMSPDAYNPERGGMVYSDLSNTQEKPGSLGTSVVDRRVEGFKCTGHDFDQLLTPEEIRSVVAFLKTVRSE